MSDEHKVEGADRGVHAVDGIVEEDNRLPTWWLGTFVISVLFAFGYVFYYLVGDGPTLTEEYRKEQVALQLASSGGAAMAASSLQAELEQAAQSADRKKKGSELFQSRCASCHGKAGEGGIGPNLTDSFWLHGAKPAEIAKTINEGVLDKGMPPWSASIAPPEVASLVAYIVSLKGTNPPNAKAPQGVEVKL